MAGKSSSQNERFFTLIGATNLKNSYLLNVSHVLQITSKMYVVSNYRLKTAFLSATNQTINSPIIGDLAAEGELRNLELPPFTCSTEPNFECLKISRTRASGLSFSHQGSLEPFNAQNIF